jgi:hypothetical protein
VSVHAINKVCWLANRDDRFRQMLVVDPERTLRQFTPALMDEERVALLHGDVGALVAFGANRYLLAVLGRRGLFGLDRDAYTDRLRSAYASSPKVRSAMYPGMSDRDPSDGRSTASEH